MTTYIVYEIFPDGTEVDVGTISHEKFSQSEADILNKYGFYSNYFGGEQGHRYALTLNVFETIYGFQKGLNGFALRWDIDGLVGTIYWRIDTWRIRKTEDEPNESIQDQ